MFNKLVLSGTEILWKRNRLFKVSYRGNFMKDLRDSPQSPIYAIAAIVMSKQTREFINEAFSLAELVLVRVALFALLAIGVYALIHAAM